MAVTIYPPDESAAQIFTEKAWLQGETLLAVFWGINFTLFFTTCFLYYEKFKQRTASRYHIGLFVYTCILFGFGTIVFVSVTGFVQFAYITDRNYPGGPAQVQTDLFSVRVDEPSNVAFVIGNWLADILIVWRYAVIYQGCRVPRWLILAPIVLLLLGDIAIGSLFCHQLSTASPYTSPSAINWTIPYFSISLSLNIIVTLAIVGRILLHRYRVVRIMGPGYGAQYAGIAAMVIESASVYTLFSLLFLIPFAIGSPLSHIFLRAMGGVQLTATLLIVMRVAQGRAWNASTAGTMLDPSQRPAGQPKSRISTVRFASNTFGDTTTEMSSVAPSQIGHHHDGGRKDVEFKPSDEHERVVTILPNQTSYSVGSESV